MNGIVLLILPSSIFPPTGQAVSDTSESVCKNVVGNEDGGCEE
jgi:hypothetical protein